MIEIKEVNIEDVLKVHKNIPELEMNSSLMNNLAYKKKLSQVNHYCV